MRGGGLEDAKSNKRELEPSPDTIHKSIVPLICTGPHTGTHGSHCSRPKSRGDGTEGKRGGRRVDYGEERDVRGKGVVFEGAMSKRRRRRSRRRILIIASTT